MEALGRRVTLSKATLHRETGAEPGHYGSGSAEATRNIEAFRVGVAHDVQDPRGDRSG